MKARRYTVIATLGLVAVLTMGAKGCGSTSKAATSQSQRTAAAAPAPATPPTPATTAAPAMSKSQQQAVKAAQQYLSDEPGFSQQGLINQLSSSAGDGFAVADATLAVNGLNVDWNAQAAIAAKNYLKTEPFSCSGMEQQLSSSAGDNFTTSQAQYGAKAAGLC